MKHISDGLVRSDPHWWRIGLTCFVLIVILAVAILSKVLTPVAVQMSAPLFAQIEDVPPPSPLGAHEPSLTSHEDTLYMSWMEQAGSETKVMMARRNPDGWSVPRLVYQGRDLFINWADFPGIAVFEDGTIAVHWLRAVSYTHLTLPTSPKV